MLFFLQQYENLSSRGLFSKNNKQQLIFFPQIYVKDRCSSIFCESIMTQIILSVSTLSMLDTIFSRRQFEIFSYFFPRK